MLGQAFTGKTSLVCRYSDGEYIGSSMKSTVGAAFRATVLDIDGTQVSMGIWDTAGQERYSSMSRIYYRAAKAAVLTYDVTVAESLAKVKHWAGELARDEPACKIYIVGTKVDLVEEGGAERQREVGELASAAQRLALSLSPPAEWCQVSAKTNVGVTELFTLIATDYLKEREKEGASHNNNGGGGVGVGGGGGGGAGGGGKVTLGQAPLSGGAGSSSCAC